MDQVNGRLATLHSAAYSGATLFSILFNQLSEVSSDGEMFFPSRKRITKCSCGILQNECKYYTEIFKDALTETGNFNLDYFYYVPKYMNNYYFSRAFEGFWINPFMHKVRNWFLYNSKHLNKINENFIKLHVKAINTSLTLKGSKVYLDGTKWARRTELFAEKGYPVSIIHLVRDPRGFCCSYLINKKLKKNLNTIKKAITAWEKHIIKVNLLIERIDCEYTQIIYEDLCKDPDTVLSKICDFLGVNYSEEWKQYSTEGMHVTGNRMRFKFDGKIVHNEKWRKYFSSKEQYLINKEAQKIENKYKRIINRTRTCC